MAAQEVPGEDLVEAGDIRVLHRVDVVAVELEQGGVVELESVGSQGCRRHDVSSVADAGQAGIVVVEPCSRNAARQPLPPGEGRAKSPGFPGPLTIAMSKSGGAGRQGRLTYF